jgi:hypothetical protein
MFADVLPMLPCSVHIGVIILMSPFPQGIRGAVSGPGGALAGGKEGICVKYDSAISTIYSCDLRMNIA